MSKFRFITASALRCTAAVATLLACGPGQAAETYQTGTLSNITTTAEGLMIMLDVGVPTNCTGTPYGWMLIPQSDKTMVATALAMWFSGQRGVTVYTGSYTGNGYCPVYQLDPH